MSRYDHAKDRNPKKNFKGLVKDLLGKGIRERTEGSTPSSSSRPGQRVRGRLDVQGETELQGETGSQGYTGTWGSTGVGRGYDLVLPLRITDPPAIVQPVRPFTTPAPPQAPSMNSLDPITPSADGTMLEGRAPSSLHFTITGPGGYRAFIPVRNLRLSVRNDTDLIIRLSTSIMRAVVNDVQQNGGGRVRTDGQI